MAIDSTKGLPSFSEMYSAYKNRGGLGDVINAGVSGYYDAKAAKSKENLQASEAEKNRAAAKKDLMPKEEGVIRLDQILDPKEKQDLMQYAKPNDQGLLVLPISTYNAVTKRGQGQEALDLKNQLTLAQQQQAEERAKNAQELTRIQQEKADLQAQLGPRAQELSATSRLAEEAGKVDAPTLLQRGVSGVKEAFGGKPLESVLAERQGSAARSKLSEIGKVNPVDESQGIGVFNSKTPTVNTSEEYDALKPGTVYRDSYGNIATKPGKRK
jgi:hypothetical protein